MASRRFLRVVILPLCLLGVSPLRAQDHFEVESVVTRPGGSFVSRVLLTHALPLQGYQFILTFDSTVLTLIRVDLESTDVARLVRDIDIMEANVVLDPETGLVEVSVGVIFEFGAPFENSVLPPGERQSVAALHFQAAADPELTGTCTALDLQETRDGVAAVDGEVCFEDRLLFRRGDCNGDGSFAGQVTDALFLLRYIFQGGLGPPCLAACDVNGDGAVEITDAISALSYNFLGGSPPPAPFPDCGVDPLPADETLACDMQHRLCP